MCWCNPSLKTPCCGGVNCHPPVQKNQNKVIVLSNKEAEILDLALNLAMEWCAYRGMEYTAKLGEGVESYSRLIEYNENNIKSIMGLCDTISKCYKE